MAENRICSILACGKPTYGQGLCRNHYQKCRRDGCLPRSPRTPATVEQHMKVLDMVLNHEGDNCLLWPYGKSAQGYGFLTKTLGGEQVHRYVCAATYGPAPTKKHQAAHSCGNRACCNPKHLRWATPRENNADKHGHGKMPMGETHYKTKISNIQIAEMRALSGKMSNAAIGRMFGVSAHYVSRIVRHLVR